MLRLQTSNGSKVDSKEARSDRFDVCIKAIDEGVTFVLDVDNPAMETMLARPLAIWIASNFKHWPFLASISIEASGGEQELCTKLDNLLLQMRAEAEGSVPLRCISLETMEELCSSKMADSDATPAPILLTLPSFYLLGGEEQSSNDSRQFTSAFPLTRLGLKHLQNTQSSVTDISRTICHVCAIDALATLAVEGPYFDDSEQRESHLLFRQCVGAAQSSILIHFGLSHK